MPQQFDNQDLPLNATPLRSQRMTADEAKAVIDLWQRERDEQTGLTDRPAVPDVAEGLNIGVEDVQRLLGEVRERRAEEERALAYEQELTEIRLAEMERKHAEEERKLAEVRRQRAELRREQTESEQQEQERRDPQPQQFPLHVAPPPAAFTASDEVKLTKKSLALTWPLAVLIISILVVIWLIFVVCHRS